MEERITIEMNEDLAHELFLWLTNWSSREFAIYLKGKPIIKIIRLAHKTNEETNRMV